MRFSPAIGRELVAICLFATLLPRPAHAELIDFGGGLIYDSAQDLTWLDPAFAQPPHTSMDGTLLCPFAPCDFSYTWLGATSWVADLRYEGYDDWRLPDKFTPSQSRGDNELRRMVDQLPGWEFGSSNGDPFALLATGERGPFLTTPDYWFVWMNEPYTYTYEGGYDFPDHLETATRRVRPVRSGAPVSKVPEPSTLGLLALGAVGVAIMRRRRTPVSRR
jgi:hypothetical protein